MEHAPPPQVVAVVGFITAEMARQDISIGALAERTGIPKTTLWRHLRGQTSFDLRDLHLIAFQLGYDLDVMFREADAA